MVAKTYRDKLLDPRWQKVRLKVFERDEWACKSCGASTSTLHVHHKDYIQGREPWDYPLENFLTLCERCHGRERTERYGLEKALLAELKKSGVLVGHLEGVAAKLIAENSGEFQEALAAFLDGFKLVFDHDWDLTKSRLAEDSSHWYISKDGTFLRPKVRDESNNWANRGSLLDSYRNLLEVMKGCKCPSSHSSRMSPLSKKTISRSLRSTHRPLPEYEGRYLRDDWVSEWTFRAISWNFGDTSSRHGSKAGNTRCRRAGSRLSPQVQNYLRFMAELG